MCNDISQLKSLTKEIVREIIKSNDNFQSVSPALVKVIDYMRKYYMQDLTLTKIAGIIIINPSYLSRLFKEQIGKNLIEYLIMIRIEAAAKLMGNANMNIKEISEKCGFKNSQYFSKVFKKHTGLKPLEFRHSMYFQEENQK
jgi:two-component system response regulator YesN